MTVTNEGVAPIYRDAYFSAGAVRSEDSLFGLLPGHELEVVIENVAEAQLQEISIQSDAILPSQVIQFEADLR